jgi:uncharacterized protein (DUF362 family)
MGNWAMVASKDIMAADATAARIMNHDVNGIKQLTMGLNMGLGEKIDNLRVSWKAARLKG